MLAVNFNEMSDAKEMLVLADSSDEQKMWIRRLLPKIRKKGFVKGAAHQGSVQNTCITRVLRIRGQFKTRA